MKRKVKLLTLSVAVATCFLFSLKSVSASYHKFIRPVAILSAVASESAVSVKDFGSIENGDEEQKDEEKDKKVFQLFQSNHHINDYSTFEQAVSMAKQFTHASVYFTNVKQLIWTNEMSIPDSFSIDEVPVIYQMPELMRGCEVTSLAMLLNYAGIDVDKMTLADQVIKDPTEFEIINGTIFFGNPNDGFVGNMETFEEQGYGVYHGPVKQLAEQYLPHRVIDLTGADLADVLSMVSLGSPVWVIVNTEYEPLPEEMFETWDTPEGLIDITYQEHSVVITGYDNDFIYMNDPLEGSTQASRESFEAAWIQMGKQAISYWKQNDIVD